TSAMPSGRTCSANSGTCSWPRRVTPLCCTTWTIGSPCRRTYSRSARLRRGPCGPPPHSPRQAHGLNENYGRELMELHTLGVNGGYTQQDVIAVARCFTGWTIKRPFTDPQFVYADFMHDHAEKTVLGHKIAAGGGEQDGLQVIDILAHHPSTAKFISRKLAQRFVADDPPPALVE